MKKNALAIFAILGLASITILFIGEVPGASDPGLQLQQTKQEVDNGREGSPEEVRTPSSIGEVIFPHLEHIEDFEIECHECHHEIKATALNMPHEEYFEDFWIECGICHKDGEAPEGAVACSNCHHEHPNGVADQTLSSKVVIHKNCWECHDIGTGAEASGECSFCHSGDPMPYSPPASDL